MITKPADTANHYANYFESKINGLRKLTDSFNPKKSLTNLIDNNIMLNKMCSFSLSLVTTKEIMQLLEALPDGKATGYDLMDNMLLRYAASEIAPPFRCLYNWSIEIGQFPEVWKEAKLCRILKNRKPFSPVNSGPISLYPHSAKC